MITKFSDYKKYFDIDFNKAISETLKIKEVNKDIIVYNQEQLSEGIDSNSKVIETIASQEQKSGFPYARFTVSERSKKGLQVRNVDLKVTGELWQSMEVQVKESGSEVLADMQKSDGNVMDNFDKSYDFWGLTKNNLDNFVWLSFFGHFTKRIRKLLTV
jgi:hypothetical protein